MKKYNLTRGGNKMKKKVLLLMTFLMAFGFILAACGDDDDINAGDTDDNDTIENVDVDENDDTVDSPYAAFGLDENMRFTEQRTITVALWDRGDERIPVFADSYWAEWVQAQILEAHNIIVEWETVPRWSEADHQSTLLGANAAPDIGLTFNDGLVATFAQMDGLQNMYPLLQEYGELLPHLYNLVGDMLYWNLDPSTNELFSLTGRLFQDGRSLTFIREDWLNILELPIPTTLEEFEETLIAFRDNAEALPGNQDGQVIAYLLGNDVTWHGSTLFESLVPSDITEREWFIHNLPGNNNERLVHFEDVMREGARVFNRWFHEDLLWNDFVIAEDYVGGDLISLGNVGAFTGNWDFPFRAAEGLITGMHENVGPDANFIPITPFVNDAGEVRMFFPNPTDRFIFFPTTNEEQLASLLYLDFMSRPEVLDFLQFGFEGVHHEILDDGVIAMLPEAEDNPWPDNQVIPSLRNFDIALTINGIHFYGTDPERAISTLALGYPGISEEAIIEARQIGLSNAYWFRNVMTRPIASEEAMVAPLLDARDVFLHTVIAGTSPEDFDETFDRMYEDYMNLGARTIMEEREQAWIEAFGDVDTMPE